MRSLFLVLAALGGGVLLGCPARSPADQDACTTDAHCGSGLICCHSSEEGLATSSARAMDRGFCVKSAVCANVTAPGQAPLPQD